MLIAVPNETVPVERRVAVTPDGAAELRAAGHAVLVETQAGIGSGFADAAYADAGCEIAPSAEETWARAELLAKCKQPTREETALFREGLVYLGYAHAVYRPWLVDALLGRRVTCFASEEVALEDGSRPLLIPMSEIAGRLAALLAAQYLANPEGRGVLLGAVAGEPSARVLILGGGTAGAAAAASASALGAEVAVLDARPEQARTRLRAWAPTATVHASPPDRLMVEDLAPEFDALINCIHWDPATGEHLLTREGLKRMRRGAVIVDVDCTPAGAIETTKQMTLDCPSYEVEGILHHCVPNMPAAVPHTSTRAFATATLPYLRLLADRGVDGALAECPALAAGLITRDGELLNQHVAEVQGH